MDRRNCDNIKNLWNRRHMQATLAAAAAANPYLKRGLSLPQLLLENPAED
jgi:hypothetical protein